MSAISWILVALPASLTGDPAIDDVPTGTDETPAETTWQPPKFDFLRQNEDWRGLATVDDVSATGDFTDRFKYVPLSDDGEISASFGGHARARFESASGFAFDDANEDSFLLTRLLVHGDVRFSEDARVYTELKAAHNTDRDLPGGTRTLDRDTFDLQQAFLDYSVPVGEGELTFRPGRQSFLFGKQRLVSPLPWGNTLRAWDGVSLLLDYAEWSVSTFYTQFVSIDTTDFNEADDGNEFFGAYATRPVGKHALDVYALGIDRDAASFNGTTGAESRTTLGSRYGGAIGSSRYDFDVEGAFQIGEVGAGDVSAFMFASQFGRSFAGPLKPRAWIGLDFASGDSDAADPDVGTFNHLFPLGHAYFGFADAVGRQNVVDISAGASVQPMEDLTMGIAYHDFTLADEADALYNAGGAVVVAGGTSTSTDVGGEIDLTATMRLGRHVTGSVGFSHFFAGQVVEDGTAGDDFDFAFFSVQYTL